MKTPCARARPCAAALLAISACNKQRAATARHRNAADAEGAEGRRRQDHRRRPRRRTASSWPRPRPPGSTRRSPAQGPTRCSSPTMPRSPRAPAGTFDTKPENRAQLTGVLTNLILPGTVLAADIDKAIDNGKGKARAGDDGRRNADRDQGRRQDRPHRRRRPQGDGHPGRRAIHQRRRPPRRCGADAGQAGRPRPPSGRKPASSR